MNRWIWVWMCIGWKSRRWYWQSEMWTGDWRIIIFLIYTYVHRITTNEWELYGLWTHCWVGRQKNIDSLTHHTHIYTNAHCSEHNTTFMLKLLKRDREQTTHGLSAIIMSCLKSRFITVRPICMCECECECVVIIVVHNTCSNAG